MHKFQLFLTFLCLLINGITAKGQVTMGSSVSPVKGSLLSIQEFEPIIGPGGVNSTKGIMLPRVELKKLSNMEGIEHLTASDYANHIGLTVYNIGNDPCENLFPGLYAWYGDQWKQVGNSTAPQADIYEDSRDTSAIQYYRTATFTNPNTGLEATWFLENVRAKVYDDTNKTSIKLITNKSDASAEGTKFYTHPGYDSSRTGAEGYFYSGSAALNDTSISTTIEKTGSSVNREVQGVCPQGWRIPNYEDWLNLFEIIEEESLCDIAYPLPQTGFELGALIRPGTESTNYTSRQAQYGGFFAHPTGAYYWNGVQHPLTKDYPAFAMSYPAKLTEGTTKYYFYSPMFFKTNSYANEMHSSVNTTMPVRCVKGALPPVI